MQGKFIVIDGIDGSGKTVQIQKLAEALEFAGFSVAEFKFPFYGGSSEALLKDFHLGHFGKPSAFTSAVFYGVNFLEGAEVIKKYLSEGKVVLCQRYVTASLAHQAKDMVRREDRIRFFKWLDEFAYGILELPRPDLTFVLDISEILAHQFIRSLHRPRPEQSLDTLEKCRKVYLEIAELMPKVRSLECSPEGVLRSEVDIHNQLWELTRRLVLKQS